ncbi:MAG: TIGR02678 family protein [Pseudonocardiales bacterium]|nr:TIGR02678 family protein [Pseudonocardiales bacterium]MBV9729579.1 TIGR02678 family protein [Pseudonocardiales bacterium]
MSGLGSQLDRIEAEETSRAIRLLLAHPLLTVSADPNGFDLVRRRRDALARWFEEHCGWRLVVQARDGYARLLKIRPEIDGTRPLRRDRSTRAPFDRRRYTLLAIVCAELLATPVTTIGLLADRVAHATAAEPGIESFQTARRSERAAFVDALKLLERAGALRALDGTAESYLDSDTAKVLFQVDTTLLLRLLAAPQAPSTVNLDDPTVLALLTKEPRYGAAPAGGEVSDAQRNLWLRHSITRALLDDPVVYRDELTEAQLGYLASPTGRRLIRQAAEQAGFVLEERAEGYLLVDPDGLATDQRFPDDTSHPKIAALVLLDHLVAAGTPVADNELVHRAVALLERFPSWAKTYRSEEGATRLAADAVDVLCAFKLAAREEGRVRARPAAARFAVATPVVQE